MAESWEDDDGYTINDGQGARRAAERYVRELAMDKWRSVLEDPSYALSQDPEAWRRIRRDAHFAFLIQTRRRKTASRGWRIVPATDDPVDRMAAGIVEQAVKKIPRFWNTRFALAEADFRGSAYAAITGQVMDWAPMLGLPSSQTPPQKLDRKQWWMFNRLPHVDRYRFRSVPRDGHFWPEIFSPRRGVWEPLQHPEWFIRHVYDEEEESRGHGTGLLDPLYMVWYSKMTCMELGLQGVEAWANGRITAAIDGLRDPSGKTNATVAAAWRSAVRSWLRDHVLTHDERDKIEMHDGPTQGHNMAVDFMRYCDNSASQLVLGSVLPFGGDQGSGSLARAEEEGDQSDEYIQPGRDSLGETLTDTIIRVWWERNWGNLCELGLERADPPELELYAEPRKDTTKNAEVLAIALQHGDVQEEEFYEKLDLTPPGPEDRVISKQEPAESNPFGGGFGMGGFNIDQPAQVPGNGQYDQNPAGDPAQTRMQP